MDVGAFLNRGPIAPEHQALLRLIGTLAHEESRPVASKAESSPWT
jgi:hypothetical protein